MTPHLTVEDVATRYATSPRAIHGKTRLRNIPMIRRHGFRRVLFPPDWLDQWDAGATLHVIEQPDGTIIVKPEEATSRGNTA